MAEKKTEEISDIGPESKWEQGKSWMRQEISSAVEVGILKPISDLRVTVEKDVEDFKNGFLFGNDDPDVFCNVATSSRVEKLQTRVQFSNYLISPMKFGFPKSVRILAIAFSFISKCRKAVSDHLKLSEENSKFKFSMFHVKSEVGVTGVVASKDSLLDQFCPSAHPGYEAFLKTQTTRTCGDSWIPTDEFIHQSLIYFYRKAAKEVQQFVPKEKVEKIAVLKDGILFSRGRIADGMNFVQTGGIEVSGLGSLGLKSHIPVVDRFSPLAYAIGNYVHWNLAQHRGAETCSRVSLEHVSIIQSASLYKEIGEDCIKCRIKRKKFVDVPMGLVSDHQLSICPPFWVSQADLFGPINVFVPGFERKTRNRQVMEAKVWVLVLACPVSRLLNLQVVEKSDSSGIIEGLTRVSCEVGVPKILLIDQDSAVMKALSEVEFEVVNLKLEAKKLFGIEFSTCPVAGHNMNGQVERRIRTIQESLEEAGLKQKVLHATGLQTMLKLVENQLNNLPIGYSFGRDADNTSLLKMLTPNMLRVGRSNERSLNGPMMLPGSPSDLLKRVQETYDTWFRIWNTAYLPKLMYQPKWWKHEVDLKEEDIVLYRKHEGDVASPWVLGIVEQLVRGRDGFSRRAIIKHRNASEDTARLSDRHVRKLVKVWSIEDQSIAEDIAAVHRKLVESDCGKRVADLVLEPGRGDSGYSEVLDAHVSCGIYCNGGFFHTLGGSKVSLVEVTGTDAEELTSLYGCSATISEVLTDTSTGTDAEDERADSCSGTGAEERTCSCTDAEDPGAEERTTYDKILRDMIAMRSVVGDTNVAMDVSCDEDDLGYYYEEDEVPQQSLTEMIQNLNLYLE